MADDIQNGWGAQALDLNQQQRRYQNAIVSGCAASDGTNAMEIDVADGEAIVAGSRVSVSATTLTLSASNSDPRKDVVYIDSAGTPQVATGTAAPAAPSGETGRDTYQPQPPDLSATDAAVVAEVWVGGGVSDTGSGDISDRRVFADAVFGSVDAQSASIDDGRLGVGSGETQLTDDGAWVWFTNPRAVHYADTADKTYTGWVNRAGDIVAASLDHSTGTVTTTTLSAALDPDDHANPSVAVLDDGRLIYAYSPHSGSPLAVRISSSAEDISTFDAEQSVLSGAPYTYANVVNNSTEGRVYIFFRASDSLDYVYSTDDGSSWSSQSTLFTPGGGSGDVYFQLHSDGQSRVEMALTDSEKPNATGAADVYHAYLDSGTLRASDGTALSPPTAVTNATQVYDSSSTGRQAWVWGSATHGGNPEIVWATWDSDVLSDHRYHHARWDGSSWLTQVLTDAGSFMSAGVNGQQGYSNGVVLDPTTAGTVYASVGDHRASKIQRWATDDYQTWRVTDITDAVTQHVRPVVPKNRHDDLPVLWMEGNYVNWATGEYFTGIVGGRRGSATATTAQERTSLAVKLDSTQDYDSGNEIVIRFNNAIIDSLSEFVSGPSDPNTGSGEDGTVTIKEGGVYCITAQIQWQAFSSTGSMTLSIDHGNRDTVWTQSVDQTNQPVGMRRSVTKQLDPGTLVLARAEQTTGATQTVSDETTRFEIERVD